MWLLIENPEQVQAGAGRRKPGQGRSRGIVAGCSAPVQGLSAKATRDVEIHGVKIPGRKHPARALRCANATVRAFEKPDDFDVTVRT